MPKWLALQGSSGGRGAGGGEAPSDVAFDSAPDMGRGLHREPCMGPKKQYSIH